jgi:hypothetical protein
MAKKELTKYCKLIIYKIMGIYKINSISKNTHPKIIKHIKNIIKTRI